MPKNKPAPTNDSVSPTGAATKDATNAVTARAIVVLVCRPQTRKFLQAPQSSLPRNFTRQPAQNVNSHANNAPPRSHPCGSSNIGRFLCDSVLVGVDQETAGEACIGRKRIGNIERNWTERQRGWHIDLPRVCRWLIGQGGTAERDANTRTARTKQQRPTLALGSRLLLAARFAQKPNHIPSVAEKRCCYHSPYRLLR
jgi:hypothetical protein